MALLIFGVSNYYISGLAGGEGGGGVGRIAYDANTGNWNGALKQSDNIIPIRIK